MLSRSTFESETVVANAKERYSSKSVNPMHSDWCVICTKDMTDALRQYTYSVTPDILFHQDVRLSAIDEALNAQMRFFCNSQSHGMCLQFWSHHTTPPNNQIVRRSQSVNILYCLHKDWMTRWWAIKRYCFTIDFFNRATPLAQWMQMTYDVIVKLTVLLYQWIHVRILVGLSTDLL